MAKHREIEHMRIEPADEPKGSSQIHVQHKPPKTQTPGQMWSGNSRKITAGTPEEAGHHVTRILREHMGAKEGKGEYGMEGDEPDAGKQEVPKG